MVRGWRVAGSGRMTEITKPSPAPVYRSPDNTSTGLELWHEHATLEDGGISVEAGVQELHDRMKGERFKIFNEGNDDFIEEMGLYHRVNGLLVKESDDAISAVRYALMMRRHGRTDASRSNFNREIKYPKWSIA